MRGWVKIHRQLLSHQLWLSEKFTRGQAWVDLFMLANHRQGIIRVRGLRITVERGQVGHSEVALAARWQWSRDKVRRFMRELEVDNMVSCKRDNKTSIVTILNYDQYQKSDTADQTADKTASQTANQQQTGTNKNFEKLKTTEEAIASSSCAERSHDPSALNEKDAPESSTPQEQPEQKKRTATRPAPVDDSPQFIELQLNTGEMFPITEAQVLEWEDLYPIVDVRQELRNYKGWLIANPRKRKTKGGIIRSVNSWLADKQNKGGTSRALPGIGLQPRTVREATILERDNVAKFLTAQRQEGQPHGLESKHGGFSAPALSHPVSEQRAHDEHAQGNPADLHGGPGESRNEG